MKTYEEMAQSALKRINEHEVARKRQKKIIAKTIIPAVCFCIVAAIGFGIRQGKAPTNVPDDANVPKTTVNNSAQNPDNQNGNTQEHSDPKQNNGISHNAPFNFDPREYIEIISSYEVGSSATSYATPMINGNFFLSIPLRQAMEEYGNDVLYRVVVDVFKDETPIEDESNLKEVSERLCALGYITAWEEYNDGAEKHSYLTLHATAEQLQNFSADSNYGYFLWLYDEYVCMTK